MTQYICKECCDSTTGFERTISSLWCVSNSNQMYWCGHARKKNYLDWSSTDCKLLMMCFGVSGRKSHSINAEVDFWATLETILAIWASDIQIVLSPYVFTRLTPYLPQAPPREMWHRTRMFTSRLYFVKKNHFKFYFPENEKSTRQNGRVIYDFYSPERAWHSHWRVGER